MPLLQLVIPTKNRIEKLTTCVNSIFHSARDLNVLLDICFSIEAEKQYFENWFHDIPNIRLHLIDEYRVPDFWNGWLQKMEGDFLVYLNDDCELFDDTLRTTIDYLEKYFPDKDGVLGLNQINLKCPNKVDAAFGVIGTKYADRFPKRQVFPICYDRFYADWELCEYAKSIGKFVYGELAQVQHYHPAFYPELKDKTHFDARKYLIKDKETFKKRQKLGLLWGRNFTTEKER